MRKQFGIPEKPEKSLISYPLHQYRLLPKMAWAFVNKFAVDENLRLYDEMKPLIIDPTKKLPFFHAISSFTKVYVTSASMTTYYEVRQALGGFGYSYYSEIDQMLKQGDINTTWEGDNRVLLQQTARFVLKNCNRVIAGKEVHTPHVAYLKDFNNDKQAYLTAAKNIDLGSQDLSLS